MANPFEKRATEYLRDDEAYLAIVSPEPIAQLFNGPAKAGTLFEQLAMIVGTPGSGKTTMARLFQYPTLRLLVRNSGVEAYRPLLANLNKIGAVIDDYPAVVGSRLPLESEYREFWEFPYSDDLKLGLMTALIQARAVISWIRSLQTAGFELNAISVIPRESTAAALTSIGGRSAAEILERATSIEYAIYQVSAALVPPAVNELPSEASAAYRPFDVIEAIEVSEEERVHRLRPLVILDDAHNLHAEQFERLSRWLGRRELQVARWIITRYDALTPSMVLHEEPGHSKQRETTLIRVQGGPQRKTERNSFRRLARDMSTRYLKRMDTFNRRGSTDLALMLEIRPEVFPRGKMDQLRTAVNSTQKRLGITEHRRQELEASIDEKLGGADPKLPEEVRLAATQILLHRYANRTKSTQVSLFDEAQEDGFGPSPSRPLSVDASLRDGAEIHLLHNYDRPYFYGFERLCDAGTENAEQYLQLAADIVDQLETKLIRGRSVSLNAREQQRILQRRADILIRDWNFPHAKAIARLTDAIARTCVDRSLEPSAPLGGGAGGVGIDREEWDNIITTHPRLTKVLQYAIAYNVLIVASQSAKGQEWSVLELGGALRLKHGLTLNRGGWVPSTLEELATCIGGEGRA